MHKSAIFDIGAAKLRTLTSALGVTTAGAVYVLGRLIKSPVLAASSTYFDQNYLRGYASRLQAKRIKSEMFHKFAQAAMICASANRSVDEESMSLFPKSHGQLLQDVVCALVHNRKRNGYFVEVGVGDGTKYSNTLMLERDFGWQGILAEPAVMFHDKILSIRTAILDRRAVSNVDRQDYCIRVEQ